MTTVKTTTTTTKGTRAKKETSKEKESSIMVTADVGSFNIKLDSGLVVENRFEETEEENVFEYETIEFEGKKYKQGKGAFDNNPVKADRNYLVPLLFTLGKAGISGCINLIMHLPATQMAKKDEVVETLKGKTFKFTTKTDGKKASTRTVTFNKVAVLKEGFSSFYSLPKRNEGLIAIIDIGGRTTDVFTFIDGKENKSTSIPVGTIKVFNEMVSQLATTRECKVDEIKMLLDKKLIDIKEFDSIIRQRYNDLLNDLKLEFPNLRDFNIKLCGGGSEFFRDCFKETFENVSVLDNYLTSNVDGAAKLGEALGFNK